MIKLSKKEASSVMSISPKYVAKKNKFLSFLLKADYKSCIKMAEEIAKTKNAIKDFYLHIVQPAIYEIGELWEKGKISVAEEHLATSIVSRIMANMYKKIIIEKKNKSKAIITSGSVNLIVCKIDLTIKEGVSSIDLNKINSIKGGIHPWEKNF